MKSFFSKIFASISSKKESKWVNNPIDYQDKIFQKLIEVGSHTLFGKDHHFGNIKTYDDFKKHVPIRDYEEIKSYIDQVVAGEKDILWKGKPLYLAKTSGTTSGAKYIPISNESIPYHILSARNALLDYIHKTSNSNFVSGKVIFLQGSPTLDNINGIKTGRLSGISAHYVPKYLQKNSMPSWATNCIEDWEEKVEKIVEETIHENMTLISGIPPWLVMYYEKLIEKSGKKVIKDIFPNLQLMVTGGVNYKPYKEKIIELLGKEIDVIQTYPASEGFIAYQNDINSDDLLLQANHGVFYEFIPVNEFYNDNPTRNSLKDVQVGVDYVLILNTYSGLWGYNIGDTVRFTNTKPYKIFVTGRIKHFTSAFGEHVIAHEVEQAMQKTLLKFPAQISEFTLAPQVNPKTGLPYHEWFIEFAKEPDDLNLFAEELDFNLRALNVYYNDLISGNILRRLIITKVKQNGFNNYMKSQGKLGGQNKVPRLSNDRKIADEFHNKGLIIN
ncbi:MAG: GH3 auxin-responsive promoter family protein [Crocinitomicaceae bacterium]|nr:GH3 auxin-responsive promoter family protein [Crocinitomicaceae bacterium]